MDKYQILFVFHNDVSYHKIFTLPTFIVDKKILLNANFLDNSSTVLLIVRVPGFLSSIQMKH